MKQPKRWRTLDNAAKLFPPTSSKHDSRVFRVACELKEEVDPAELQLALDKTMELFPFYRAVMKQGLFWYYLEDSDLPIIVTGEKTHPCTPLYSRNKKKLLFEVTYYRRRINLEVYHVLSDGTGALQFLRTMVLFYLQKKHNLYQDEQLHLDYDAAQSERNFDSFSQYFLPERLIKKRKVPKSYKIKGDKLPPGRTCVIEALMSAKQIREAAKTHGATITEFLTTIFVMAIGDGVALQHRNLPVTIGVPVNLRQYFHSRSARNFFSVINVSCQLGEHIVFDDILEQVRKAFADELTEDKIRTRMNTFASLEHNLAMKVVPLALKDPIMGAVAKYADRRVTAGLSNVGRIDLPEVASKHIRLIDAFNSTRNLQMLIVSYLDNFIINFTSIFEATDVQRRFFSRLVEQGISCEISTNWIDEQAQRT